jgi:outer membrane protein OmpA-like peptidoglycan-associated protein
MLLAAMGAMAAIVATGVGVGVALTQKAGVAAPRSANLAPWVGRLNEDLVGRYAWLQILASGRVAKVLGEAPDAAAKSEAFAAARTAIEADAEAMAAVNVIVDGISVAGGEKGVGAALAGLGETPDAPACQTAFTETLAGRLIAFETGSATISSESAALLDALSGAALLCQAHRIEIGGHTDVRGADDANLKLSQARADAVLAYLAAKGAPTANLAAIGFGETRPLDPARTEAAYAKNRRIEFTVIAAP